MTHNEDGFTMIEVLVAAVCLALIVVAVATVFVSGNRSSLSSQQQAGLAQVADQQIEAIREAVKASETSGAGFSALAMSGTPAAGASTTLPYDNNTPIDPNRFAVTKSGCGTSNYEFAIETNYDDISAGLATTNEPTFAGCDPGSEPLIVATGGIVTPSQTVSVGANTATVDSFVTETNVGCNASLGSGSCLNDARRVTVAVKLNNANGRYTVGQNSPVYISTIFTNPTPSNAPNSSIGLILGLSIG